MMPRVAGIVGSPRKGMNTETLVRAVLDGCRESGAATEIVFLGDLAIQPCRACREQDGSGCLFTDGMAQIYELLEQADGLVLGTPVYYNTVPGQMKLMIDRCYCLAKPLALPSGGRRYVSAVAKAKKGIVVSVGGSGTNPDCVLPVFEIWGPEVNLEIVDTLLASRALLGKPPMESRELVDEAVLKGKKLAASLR